MPVKSRDVKGKSLTRAAPVVVGTLGDMARKTVRKMKPGASDHACSRAEKIRKARETRDPEPWSQATLADVVNVSRESIAQWEIAGVEEIDFVTCVRVADALGLELSDLLTEAQRKDMRNFEPLPGISPNARRLARLYDSLPKALRDWIWNAVDSYVQLAEKAPVVAEVIHQRDHVETGEFEAIAATRNRKKDSG